jgi:hypothetical protein
MLPFVSASIAPARRVLRLQQPDMDALFLCVTDQFLQALLASDPGLLVTAKKGFRENVARRHSPRRNRPPLRKPCDARWPGRWSKSSKSGRFPWSPPSHNHCLNRLTAGSRRSAPWNGSTHPGYSGSRALTSSNCLSSSWVSVSSTAARLS